MVGRREYYKNVNLATDWREQMVGGEVKNSPEIKSVLDICTLFSSFFFFFFFSFHSYKPRVNTE